ncbi:presenilin-1-like isoform X2 [Watersipora subatra]|uniref:presenilin-1-like isoform X2 n=1 Tax=Watersipora subatra TaxID=2589382 RepID=UPI00355C4D97
MADFIQMDNLQQPANMEDEETTSATNRRQEPSVVEQEVEAPRLRQRNRERRQRNEEEEAEEDLMYGAQHVIKLFVPVSLCMLVVVLTVASVAYYTDQSSGVYLAYTPFHPKADDSTLVTIGSSVGNALIVLGVVVVMTILLVLLYKYKCYKILHGWLIVSSLLMMFFFSFIYIQASLQAYNVPFDMISLMLIIWNFGCMGMVAMHWKAPLRVLQAYHIVISALLALVFIKYLPEWTLWTILVVIALWDLVAVLCPHGPLRILVNIASERNENIFPSLIYTSTVLYSVVGMADRSTDEDSSEESSSARPLNQSSAWRHSSNGYGGEGDASNHTVQADDVEVSETEEAPTATSHNTRGRDQRAEADQEPEEKGVKLGLGDFIFYSILVGKASSSGDWATTTAAYIAILMGLFFTLVLLATFKKALPALPISICFGLIFNFGTLYLISPFITQLSANQIFI